MKHPPTTQRSAATLGWRRPTRVAGAAVAMLLSLTMAACGGDESGSVGPSTAECPEGVVTLSVLRATNQVPNDQQLNDYSASVNGCVKFEVQELPFGQFIEKISVVAPTDQAPDIVGYDSPDTADYASKGMLLPLDEYIPAGWKEDVLPRR
jgi:fructooligosaccharide transport system substrate-binding protein